MPNPGRPGPPDGGFQFQDPKDQIVFQQATPQVPDAGIYSNQAKRQPARTKSLPQVRSGILNTPDALKTFDSFGIEGLKTLLLEKLVQLDWGPLQDELTYLAEGANEHREIRRTLHAVKLMAAQRYEDPRRGDDERMKCEYIFNSISTFGKIEIQPLEDAGGQMQAMEIAFPNLGPLEAVGAEVEHVLAPGSEILLMTDLQGHYDKLAQMLLNAQIAVERDGLLHWNGPKDFYLLIVGDLFNKSPYSSWGDTVGWDSFKVVKTLQRLMKVAPERILLAYGAYDLDLALGAAFDHPTSGFLGGELAVNAQAQTLPAVISFLQGTADPLSAEGAWERRGEVYQLKPEFQISGFPQLILPADESGPNLTPLLDFYQQLYQRLTHPQTEQRPRSAQELDQLAAGLLPPASETLNLQNLASSLGRSLHYLGLLEGTGTLGFLRNQVAGLHVLKTQKLELFAMHPEIQEITLDMLGEIKSRGEEGWLAPELESFVRGSRVLIERRISPDKLLAALQALRLSRLNEWLGLNELQFYQKLVQTRQLSAWVPEILPRQDEKGFTEAWRKLRWELINEDPTGLAGYAINMDGISRRGEPLMRKMAQLDERTRRSYARTFLMDLLREEAPVEMDLQQSNILIRLPDAHNPALAMVLMIDENVAIYKDPKDNLHMPVKHAAYIEYLGG